MSIATSATTETRYTKECALTEIRVLSQVFLPKTNLSFLVAVPYTLIEANIENNKDYELTNVLNIFT